jgi:hypothetical protein
MNILQFDNLTSQYNAKVYLPNADYNPAWKIKDKDKQNLIKIWDDMHSNELEDITVHKDIMYSGCQFSSDDGRNWFTYRGMTIMRKDNITEIKKDENRKFEKKLMKTAPKNLIPEVLYITEFSNNLGYKKRKTG